MRTDLRAKVILLIQQNPALLPYQRELVGCCRMADRGIQRRVAAFVRRQPQHAALFEEVLKAPTR